jgi:hypothetical protein
VPLHKLAAPSVRNVVTVGIFSGRGSLRDQFGRATGTHLTHSNTHF